MEVTLSRLANRRFPVRTVAASVVAIHVQEAAKAFGISEKESALSIILVTLSLSHSWISAFDRSSTCCSNWCKESGDEKAYLEKFREAT